MRYPLDPMPLVPVAPHQGGFGTVRRHDHHTGVDLYAADGTPLVAIEAGYVVKLGLFTGAAVGTPWWNETWAVIVEGRTGGSVMERSSRRPSFARGFSSRKVLDSAWFGRSCGRTKGCRNPCCTWSCTGPAIVAIGPNGIWTHPNPRT